MTDKKIEQSVNDTSPELKVTYSKPSANPSSGVREDSIEYGVIARFGQCNLS